MPVQQNHNTHIVTLSQGDNLPLIIRGIVKVFGVYFGVRHCSVWRYDLFASVCERTHGASSPGAKIARAFSPQGLGRRAPGASCPTEQARRGPRSPQAKIARAFSPQGM